MATKSFLSGGSQSSFTSKFTSSKSTPAPTPKSEPKYTPAPVRTEAYQTKNVPTPSGSTLISKQTYQTKVTDGPKSSGSRSSSGTTAVGTAVGGGTLVSTSGGGTSVVPMSSGPSPPSPNVPQLQQAPSQPPMSLYGRPPGSVYEEKTGRTLMPGQSTGDTSYIRGEGAVGEDRLYQALATRYAAEGLGDPRGLSTTKLAQALNRNISANNRREHQEKKNIEAVAKGEDLPYPNVKQLPTAGQVVEVLKDMSYKDFQASGGVAPPGYTRGYPSVVTSSARVNDILAGYEDAVRGMSVSIPSDRIVGQRQDESFIYSDIATPQEMRSGDAFRPNITSLSLDAPPNQYQSIQPQQSRVSQFVDEYKTRVSQPLVPGAYANTGDISESIRPQAQPVRSQFSREPLFKEVSVPQPTEIIPYEQQSTVGKGASKVAGFILPAPDATPLRAGVDMALLIGGGAAARGAYTGVRYVTRGLLKGGAADTAVRVGIKTGEKVNQSKQLIPKVINSLSTVYKPVANVASNVYRPIANIASKASKVVDAPSRYAISTIERIPGVKNLVTGTSKTGSVASGSIRVGTEVVRTEVENKAVDYVTDKRLEKLGLSKQDALRVEAKINNAEQSSYVSPDSSLVGGVAKQNLYSAGLWGDKGAAETAARQELSSMGLTGKDLDSAVKIFMQERKAKQFISARVMLASEDKGNVGGSKSISNELAKRKTILQAINDLNLGGRFLFNIKTRAAGGAAEGFISGYGGQTAKPTTVGQTSRGLYYKESLEQGVDYQPVMLDVNFGQTRISPLGGYVKRGQTVYSPGRLGSGLIGAATGAVSSSAFAGFVEAPLSGTSKYKPIRIAKKVTTNVVGYTADFPGEPLGDLYSAGLGRAPTARVRTTSFSIIPTSVREKAQAARDKAVDITKAGVRGYDIGLTGSISQGKTTENQAVKKIQKQIQKERVQERALALSQNRARVAFEDIVPVKEKVPTDVPVEEKVPVKEKVPTDVPTKESTQERTTIFTPPYFPFIPPIPGMGGGDPRQTGPTYGKPRTQKYQADYQAKVLGQYSPTAGMGSTYTGAQRRYLQGPSTANSGYGPSTGNVGFGNPFGPRSGSQKQKTGSKSAKSPMMMNLNIGL